jgi:hypothetical protein
MNGIDPRIFAREEHQWVFHSFRAAEQEFEEPPLVVAAGTYAPISGR